MVGAGSLPPVTLANHTGRSESADRHVEPGNAPNRTKLVRQDAACGTADAVGAASSIRAFTLGIFLRSFRWGRVRRPHAATPLTIDLESIICETFGLAKVGAQGHKYAGVRGYHPLSAIAAGIGAPLTARLRNGLANTTRAATHFLRETVRRVRYQGAAGLFTVLAANCRYTHAVAADHCDKGVRFSITVRQRRNVRNNIAAIPEEDWNSESLLDGGRRRCGCDCIHTIRR